MRAETVRTTRAPRGRLPAAVLITGALVIGGTLSGCSRAASLVDSTSGPVGAPTRSDAQSATKDPDTVLKQLADQLHADVEGLHSGLSVKLTNQLLDERQLCQLGSAGDWPAQWIYDQRVYLTAVDARPAGKSAVARYAADGWKVRTLPPTEGTDQYTLQRDGFVISVAAADDGSLDIQTNGPCVNSDGSIVAS